MRFAIKSVDGLRVYTLTAKGPMNVGSMKRTLKSPGLRKCDKAIGSNDITFVCGGTVLPDDFLFVPHDNDDSEIHQIYYILHKKIYFEDGERIYVYLAKQNDTWDDIKHILKRKYRVLKFKHFSFKHNEKELAGKCIVSGEDCVPSGSHVDIVFTE